MARLIYCGYCGKEHDEDSDILMAHQRLLGNDPRTYGAKEKVAGTNIVSKTLSRVYVHPSEAEKRAEAYAEKKRVQGYTATVIPNRDIYPPTFLVEVLRKR